MSTRGTISDLSTLRHKAYLFASRSKGIITTVCRISGSNSVSGRDGDYRFVFIPISLGTWSWTLGFHRPSPGRICAGGTESVGMDSPTSFQVHAAYHVSSSKNTERSNWKSRASTSCFCLCSIISWVIILWVFWMYRHFLDVLDVPS
jgi:hypothetical protein